MVVKKEPLSPKKDFKTPMTVPLQQQMFTETDDSRKNQYEDCWPLSTLMIGDMDRRSGNSAQFAK